MSLKPNIKYMEYYNPFGSEKPYITAEWKDGDSIFFPRLCIPPSFFKGNGECRIYPNYQDVLNFTKSKVKSGTVHYINGHPECNELPHLRLEDAINIFDGDGQFVYGEKVADFLIVLWRKHGPYTASYC